MRSLEAVLVAQGGASVASSSAPLTSADAVVERLAPKVLSQYERLLAVAPRWPQVQRELADLAWLLLQRAEARDDRDAATTYLRLLSAHDDGRYVDLIEGSATLEVTSDPEGAQVFLYRLDDDDTSPRHDSAPRELGRSPVAPIDLAPGRYVLEVHLPKHASARRTLRVARGSDMRLHVALFAQRSIGPNFVYVPAGRTMAGPGPAELRRPVFVDNFAIARQPVTASEFTRFIDALADDDPGQAIAYTPRHPGAGISGTSDPAAPITELSQDAAEAYCRWLSTQHGERYRLPTSAEWDKAKLEQAFTHAKGTQESRERELIISSADDPSRHGALRLVRELPPGGGEEVQVPTVPEGSSEISESLDIPARKQDGGRELQKATSEDTSSQDRPGPARISARSLSPTQSSAAPPLVASAQQLTRARWARAGPRVKTDRDLSAQASKTETRAITA